MNILLISHWRSTESIALLAGIAGLFHDFGKAGALFQAGLQGKANKPYQPFRHEWISVRLFQAFVDKQSDKQWLAKLGELNAADEAVWLESLQNDPPEGGSSPFTEMPPVAQAVMWLILSHHRLPQYPGRNAPSLDKDANWLTHQLNVEWNALNHRKDHWKSEDFQCAWTFPSGTPLQSHTWREKARQLAKRATHAISLHDFGALNQHFTVHLARLALMLADHHYSSQPPVTRWQDEAYQAWANTVQQTRQCKQKLDEHTIGVGHHALLLGRMLPGLRANLPAITRHKKFRERATNERYHWQNKAWDLAQKLRDSARQHGFFGVNMASTGCGKTLANARIMYALAQEEEGCRFTVALGLRTLTQQTGDALRTRLGLGEDDLAVLVGSYAVQDLHQQRTQPDPDESSASAEAFFEQHQYVHYDGTLPDGPLRHVIGGDNKLSKLVSAPVLVATIDHLMPATEGVRGGKQIAPMLRLLTSDLVLDEPDDFDVSDQHALCRLVHWAGMLGSRVLLSSATLPPALVMALFTAYCSGRKAFQQASSEPDLPLEVSCAWFDEYDTAEYAGRSPADFLDKLNAFASQRAKRLGKETVLRRAEIVTVSPASTRPEAVIAALADVLHREILNLHAAHRQVNDNGKTVSFGLVRMANINPLVAIARALMRIASPENTCIHYCVYHSQQPLAVRAHIEKQLDGAFTRDRENPLTLHPDIVRKMERHPAQHHIFVVLGTSVIEVGRDWDACWGIIEPSSMRSLIQFAGRIQRHRQILPRQPNMLILNKNVKALRETNTESPAYCNPGFECASFRLNSHDMTDLLKPEEYHAINAIPRILNGAVRGNRFDNLSVLEHSRTREELLAQRDDMPVAAHWWRLPVNWSGELQRRTPFRQSQPEAQFFLWMEEEGDEPIFSLSEEGKASGKDAGQFNSCSLEMAEGVSAWIDTDYATVLLALAESRDMELSDVCQKYGEINLRTRQAESIEAWLWHPVLGVFREL
ncbi:type I-F CRISPR-associated helicase Cas3f [Lelliottia nimipressuralis]|uniref:type I-F CRISPR-associated helicase Cas3f n=1 Tax=Lelliottia nimipressuralis TaxID=69220 RepID=UPI003B242E8A